MSVIHLMSYSDEIYVQVTDHHHHRVLLPLLLAPRTRFARFLRTW